MDGKEDFKAWLVSKHPEHTKWFEQLLAEYGNGLWTTTGV